MSGGSVGASRIPAFRLLPGSPTGDETARRPCVAPLRFTGNRAGHRRLKAMYCTTFRGVAGHESTHRRTLRFTFADPVASDNSSSVTWSRSRAAIFHLLCQVKVAMSWRRSRAAISRPRTPHSNSGFWPLSDQMRNALVLLTSTIIVGFAAGSVTWHAGRLTQNS